MDTKPDDAVILVKNEDWERAAKKAVLASDYGIKQVVFSALRIKVLNVTD